MKNLTLIRHAPTSYSSLGIFMGDLDIPSSEEGLRHAQLLGKALVGNIYTSYLSSPLIRAKQTAENIFPQISVEIDQDLRERGLGNWAGKPKSELKMLYPQAFLPSGHIDPYFLPEGGESIEDVTNRVRRFLENRVLACEENINVVAVTHNGIMRVIRCFLHQRPMTEIFSKSEPYLTPITYTYDGTQWTDSVFRSEMKSMIQEHIFPEA